MPRRAPDLHSLGLGFRFGVGLVSCFEYAVGGLDFGFGCEPVPDL
jgi:hypothetical protein